MLCNVTDDGEQDSTRSSSTNHDQNDQNDDHGFDEDAILSEALRHVPEYGWTTKSIQMGMKSQGLPPSSHTYFTRGPDNLIEYFEVTSNKKLIEYMEDLKNGETP